MTAPIEAIELARAAAHAAADKLGSDLVALDVSAHLPLTDVFLIVSAANERQVSAIVDNVEERLHALGVKPRRREGQREARWVLLDFGDIIVHVMHEQERLYYQLERLWKDCPAIDLDLRDESKPDRSAEDLGQ